MRRDPWARLAAPFPPPALTWCVAKLDREGGTALLEPVLAEEAVAARLDEAVGVEGWSKQLWPLGADAVVCELALLGVRKSAVARSFDGTFDMVRVSGWACGRAAALFGLEPPTDVSAWVDVDLDAGEPLFLPDVDAAPVEAAGAAPAAGETRPNEPDRGATPAGEAVAGGAGEPDGSPPEREPVDEVDEAGSSVRSEGQQAIERLIERLKGEGLGREVASLVVAFGGYGRTPEEARELYRRLRELLLEKGAPT